MMKKGFSSVDRRKAARLQFEETPRDAEAEEAAEAVSSWVSPRLPTSTRRTSFEYERSPTEWMQRTLNEPMDVEDIDVHQDDDDDDVEDEYYEQDFRQAPGTARGRGAALATPRVLQRADTPVMSNSSKKAAPSSLSSTTTRTLSGDKTPAANVPSPHVPAAYSPPRAQFSRLMQKATPLSRNYVQECRAYHDALVLFRQEKQRLVARMEREQEQTEASGTWNEMGSPAGGPWQAEEARLDRDLFHALQEACYGRTKPIKQDPLQVNPMKDFSRKEGNFWALLAALRKLGMDGLLYGAAALDDNNGPAVVVESLQTFLDKQARRVQATPLVVSQSLQGPEAPLSLRRWFAVLHWLEECHDRVLPSNIARARFTSTPAVANVGSNSSNWVDGCLPTTSRDAEVFRAALNLCLAGRLEDAIQMASLSGLEYKAAQWSGGKPAGKEGNKSVGNPRRALWQSLMWKKAELVDSKPSDAYNRDEAALAALLANHSQMALQSPSLRTWERAFYAATRAVVGRIEDDLLLQHNEHRRAERPPYPGTEWGEYENQHLENTVMVQGMTETKLVKEIMVSSPFPEMRDEDPYTSAMTAFWMGHTSVQAYMNQWFVTVQENDPQYLRFLAHLALYLDSLREGSVRRGVPAVEDWMNGIVQKYLDHLASREELFHMMVLYASFLPRKVILQSLPTLLMNIEGQPTRNELLRQMNEFLEPSLDRDILLEIARRTLEEVDFDDDDLQKPSALDDKKMRVVLWFSLRSDLFSDGLVYTNRLLRQFLLADKLTASKKFVSQVRPDSIVDLLQDGSQIQDDTRLPVDADGNVIMALENEPTVGEQLEEARVEHAALLVFLDAEEAVEYWKGVLASAEAVPAELDDPLDKTRLNEREISIAISQDRRALADEKRATSHKVTVAANQALECLSKVMKFSGGWLHVEEDDRPTSSEETSRHEELKQLRGKIIPAVVLKYRDVCMETAAWMSASLDDGVKRLEKVPAAVLGDIDRSNAPESSALAPSYWTAQALQNMEAVTSETYECLTVLRTSNRKELLNLVSDTYVAHLRYTSELEWDPIL